MVLLGAVTSIAVVDRLGFAFDVLFVTVCVAAALAVRPTEFFAVGVQPPLLLGATMLVVGTVDPTAVAQKGDGVVQATVSGLAHHATALAVGYALTLGVLALRQAVQRNHGTIRARRPQPSRSRQPASQTVTRSPEERLAPPSNAQSEDQSEELADDLAKVPTSARQAP
jgi:hypothetical protein